MKPYQFMIILGALFFLGCAETSWEKAQQEGSIEAFTAYIESDSTGEFVPRAKEIIDSLQVVKDSVDWIKAIQQNTIEAFDHYLSTHPKGNNIDIAKSKKGELDKIQKEKSFWQKVKTENNYEMYLEYCQEFPKGENFKEAWEQKELLGKELIKTRFAAIFDFFNGKNSYDHYLSKKSCTINDLKVKWPITPEFKVKVELNNLPSQIKDLGNILTAFLEDKEYDAEFRYQIYDNKLEMDFHYWPGGYGYIYSFTWEFEGAGTGNKNLFITNMTISPPESYD